MTRLIVVALTFVFFNQASSESDPNYRLNTTLIPISYDIAIRPYFSGFRFDGEVIILMEATTETEQIKLHSENLTINALNVTLYDINGVIIALNETRPLESEEKYGFLLINLKNSVKAGTKFTLSILYSGSIRSDRTGFFRNFFVDTEGIKRWLGATQMQATHARKVFPCFDEPEYKAVFTLHIDRPASYYPCLANTKLRSSQNLNNGFIRDTFHPTPKMSTYLVAFLVSEFRGYHEEKINGSNDRELGIYVRPSNTTENQIEYALQFGRKVVDALGEYFGIDYYNTSSNMKLDYVALTDFKAGAMENWGLVKYREAYLLYVPQVSSPSYLYQTSMIIAHETTHMWFGNLVTCHWWSDAWLNEGFANYFQDYITALIDPSIGSENLLVTSSVHDALTADELPSPSPISNEDVNSSEDIVSQFGTITYKKAGSVIRMIHHLVGDDAFKYGLRAYLNANKFDVGYPEDLYAALEEGVDQYNSMANYNGVTATEVMRSWIDQPGHPVLKVEIDYGTDTVNLTQDRFYSSPLANKSDNIYVIPITYTTELSPNNSTKPVFIMDSKTHSFNISGIGANHSWIIFNVQETGLYRVNYDEHSWQIIRNVLKEKREDIYHLNRAKIVNDLFAFFYAEEIKFSLLFEVLDFLSEETDYSVWLTAIRGFDKLRSSYLGTDLVGDVQNFALKKMEKIINTLSTGLDFEESAEKSESMTKVVQNDDYETVRNRMQILEFACKLGHTECVDFAKEKWQELKEEKDSSIDPSFQRLVFCNGLRYGSGDDFDLLWEEMLSTDVANHAKTMAESLGCTNDEERIKKYLFSPLNDVVAMKIQDISLPLISVLSDYNHVPIVLESLQQNYTIWDSIYEMPTVLSTVASSLRTDQHFKQFESWLANCTECSSTDKAFASASLKQAQETVEWATKHTSDIKSTLRNHAAIVTPSLSFLLFMSYIIVLFM